MNVAQAFEAKGRAEAKAETMSKILCVIEMLENGASIDKIVKETDFTKDEIKSLKEALLY
ncbi:MAG: hypothetical protein K2Q14_05780 [Gammaproteobacteria bacterium]|nr:hypothetical protein [Gammaproteobacteria bacterium]